MNDAAWKIVMELLVSSDRMGVFHLGVVVGMTLQDGVDPDRQLLVAISKCSGILAVDRIYEHWKKVRANG